VRLNFTLGLGNFVMRKWVVAAAFAAVCALVVTAPKPAAADILVNVSKASQRMSVLVDGSVRYNWAVSTGAARYTTPSGVYKPQWMARKWRSKQYGNAPMPHSIFFYNGYATHGTTEIKKLGKIASHGCVRLHPDNAAALYALVEKRMAETRIVVSNDVIEAPGEAPKKKPSSRYVAENTVSEEPVVAPTTGAAPETDLAPAVVAENVIAPENEFVAEKTRETKTPAKPARAEKLARANTPGFRW
jgi:hypothetical protein